MEKAKKFILFVYDAFIKDLPEYVAKAVLRKWLVTLVTIAVNVGIDHYVKAKAA